MRGHRSSKCTHGDRILIQVRKPGRPLSSCPHPDGQCNCSGLRVAIPKSEISVSYTSQSGSLMLHLASSCACGKFSAEAAPNALEIKTSGGREEHNGEQLSPALAPTPSRVISSRVRKSRRSSGVSASTLKALEGVGQKEPDNLGAAHRTENGKQGADPGQAAVPRTANGEDQSQAGPASASDQHVDHPAPGMSPSKSTSDVAEYLKKRIRSDATARLGHDQQHSVAAGPGTQGPNQPNGTGDHHDWPNTRVEFSEGGQVQSQPPTSGITVSPDDAGSCPPQAPEPQKQCCCGAGASQAATETSNQPDLHSAYGLISVKPPATHQPQQHMTLPNSIEPTFSQMQHPAPQPFQPTTLYTFPPRCTTFQHPLTPEELAFLQRNPNLFAHSAPQLTQSSLTNGMMSSAPLTNAATMHSCSCGDACNCLGCIAHPFNMRTMTFVHSVQDLMATDNPYDHPCSRRVSMQGQMLPDLSAAFAPVNPHWCSAPSMGSHHHHHQTSCDWTAMQPPPLQAGGQADPSSSMLPLGDPGYSYGPACGMVAMDPAAQVCNGVGDLREQQAVSPADFFHVSYPVGSGDTGDTACACGDGCTCSGCLTHGGNGTAQSAPPPPPPPPSRSIHRAASDLGVVHCSGESACRHGAALQGAIVHDGPFQVS